MVFVIHDGTKDINRVTAKSIGDVVVPKGCVCIKETRLQANQVVIFKGGNRVVVCDYTNTVFYDEATKEKKHIAEIGTEPDPAWVEWHNCFDCWLKNTVKPERKRIMDEYEWRYNRHNREINKGIEPTLAIEQIDNYMHEVHMFPDALTEIVEPLIWPAPPEE